MTTATETRKNAILRIFREMGDASGVMLDDITSRCLEEGVWSEADKERSFRKHCNSTVRRTLREAGEDGLPEALIREVHVTETNGVRSVNSYIQREFWTRADRKADILAKVQGIRADWATVRAMVKDCERAFPDDDWRALVPAGLWDCD